MRLTDEPVIRERAVYYAAGVPGAAVLCRDCRRRPVSGCCLLCDACTAAARARVAPAIEWSTQPACYARRP